MKWNGNFFGLLPFIILLGFHSTVFSHSDTIALNSKIIPKPSSIVRKPGKFFLNLGVDFQHPQQLDQQAIYLLQFFKIHQVKSGNQYQHKLIFRLLPVPQKTILDKKQEESYRLQITTDTILLTAQSPIGITRGMATLKQLILLNNDIHLPMQLPLVEVQDRPHFQHRGLLLDCSRHFFSVKTIKKYIDLLAFYKMNTLHWHLTEDQGWRIAIDKYPKLATVAAFRTEKDSSIYGGFYTKEEIKDLVQYAANQHINIIPEIELPGHSQAAIAAYPNLSCTGKSVEVANDWGVFKEIYCAGNDSVFTFLEDVLNEVIELFPSKYIHIGGDEAPKTRWEQCDKCQRRIQEQGLTDEHELQSYFIKRIQRFLQSKGKEIIGWDEILEGGLAKGAIVQSWRGVEGGIEAAHHHNQAIMSPTSHAYLDYDLKAIDLEKIYHFHPIPKNLAPQYHDFILGGECNMWTEHVPDEKTLDQKVFPRMIGMSEALWSSGEKNYQDFNHRIQAHYPILKHLKVEYGEESIPFEYTTSIKNDSLFLVLSPSSPLLRLNYQEKNTTENVKGACKLTPYQSPIHLNTTKTVTVRTYKNDQRYGEIVNIPLSVHQALGKSMKYDTPYNQWYTGGGNTALVDGKLGTLDFRDGNWQGFWGNDAKLTLDLKEQRTISEISMNFYQYSNSWIFLPKEVSVETSNDGVQWSNRYFDIVKPEDQQKVRGKFISTVQLSNHQAIKTRYIRVSIENRGKVPDWHEAAGSDAWIFMDEIQVK